MTAIEEFYLLEVERARDRDKPPHPVDGHCLCYACEDAIADAVDEARNRAILHPAGVDPWNDPWADD